MCPQLTRQLAGEPQPAKLHTPAIQPCLLRISHRQVLAAHAYISCGAGLTMVQ